MGFWAKFKGGGRQAHYFKKDEGFIFSVCGRLPVTGIVHKMVNDLHESKMCSACKKELNKVNKGK